MDTDPTDESTLRLSVVDPAHQNQILDSTTEMDAETSLNVDVTLPATAMWCYGGVSTASYYCSS